MQPTTILLVDDDPSCRALLREAIAVEQPRSDIRDVSGGQQALDYLYRRGPFAGAPRPSLVYLDADMPDVSGLDVLRAIRSDPRLHAIRVVMMTGVNEDVTPQETPPMGEGGPTGEAWRALEPVAEVEGSPVEMAEPSA